MPRKLDPEKARAIADRVQYYRDLGVYDFYRREVPPEMAERLAAQPENRIVAASSDVVPMKGKDEPPVTMGETEGVGITPSADHGDRNAALRAIREEIGDCTRCPLHKQGRKQIVFGVGSENADIMFVGEAPGADEDEQGEPFVGRAGQLLTNMIKAMGLRREDVYIANVIKCRPPGNRTPEPDECATCSPFLLKQIDVIKPKAIVALGAVAAKTLLGVNDTMANLRGHWHDFHGYPLAVTYHPAYLLRDPRQKVHTWHDLQMVMKRLGLQAPEKSS